MKILFSIHFGDSIAHILRTRGVAKLLIEEGHEVCYSVSGRGMAYLNDFIDDHHYFDNEQNYGFSRFEPMNVLINKFYQRSLAEYGLYNKFKPDLVIGDMGFVASVYCTETPLIKILNRFLIEIGNDADITLQAQHKRIITSQIEKLINNSRIKLGIKNTFSYKEFLQGPIIINGARQFVNVDLINGIYCGFKLGIKLPKKFIPRDSVAFVILGTGISVKKVDITKQLIEIIEPYFKKIYISSGSGLPDQNFSIPENCLMKTIFLEVPEDVGCLICHGGYGSIHMGMLLRIPTFVLPFHIEHFCNGRRLEQLNGGRCFGKIEGDKFDGIRQAIQIDWQDFSSALESRSTTGFQGDLADELSNDYHIFKAVKAIIKIIQS